MKVNIGQAVAPIQSNINQAADNARLTQALGGFLGGIQSARKFKLGQGRTQGFLTGLEDQIGTYQSQLDNPNLETSDRLALEDAISRLKTLSNVTDITNIDQMIGNYQKMYAPLSDPRSLATDLQKSRISADATKQAAQIRGQAYITGQQAKADAAIKLQESINQSLSKYGGGGIMGGLGNIFGGGANLFSDDIYE